MTYIKTQTLTLDTLSGTTVPISQNYLPYDGSEQLEMVVNKTIDDLINPITNREVIRHGVVFFGTLKLNFFLLNSDGVLTLNYDKVIEPLNSKTFISKKFNKSFFVLDYYISPRTDTQRLVDRTILNTFNSDVANGGTFLSEYTITRQSDAGYNIYVPKEFLDDGTIEDNTIYLKARWFNAATGEVKLLKRDDTQVTYINYDEEDLYYEIELSEIGRFYSIKNPASVGGVNYTLDFYDFVIS